MAITIDFGAKVINIPQADLTPLGGSLFELDTETKLRTDVNALMESETGIVYDTPTRHNTEVVISGITYARTIEFINGYTITFEDLQYRVNLTGSNNNLTDVLNLNQVSVIPSNSAGLIVTDVSGLTATESTRLLEMHQASATRKRIDLTGADALGWQEVLYDDLGSEVVRFNLFDETGTRITGTVSAFVDAKKMIGDRVKV